jgi:putative FmdB family regulatory protein
MPIYEYKCDDCGYHFEKMQKVSDEPLKECPKCNGKVEKQWSLSGFQFKGEGWYLTDYSNKNKPTATTESNSEKSSTTESTKPAETASKKADTSTKTE